jgi:hypothetical protein
MTEVGGSSDRLLSSSLTHILIYLHSTQSRHSTGSFGCPTVPCCTELSPVCGTRVRSSGVASARHWSVTRGTLTRWTYDGLSFLADNNVIVICLPSHTSIITQPNDNGINRAFHQHSGDLACEWREQHAGSRMQKGDEASEQT